MSWVLLAGFAALMVAGHDTIAKRLLRGRANPYFLAGAQFFVSGAVLACLVFFSAGVPVLGHDFFAALAATFALNVLATMIAFKALQRGDISQIGPMISFSPVFLILTSYLMLGEKPSAQGIGGIALIVAGSYILHRQHLRGERWNEAFRRMWRSKGSMMILGVAFIFSITSNFDKLVALNSSPMFAAMSTHLSLGVALLIITALTLRRERGVIPLRKWPWLLAMGAFAALAGWASFAALSAQIVPYVISVKRFSIVFTVLAGYLLLGENHIRMRLAGASVMLAGVVVIALS